MSQTKPNIFGIANPFTQVNITKEAGSSAYDNNEVLSMASSIYTFAQQKESRLLPLMGNMGTIQGQFIAFDRFGKFEYSIRTQNVKSTPHSSHQNSTRAVSTSKFEVGWWASKEDVSRTRYQVPPMVQMQLAYAKARDIDEVIMSSFYKPMLEYSSTAGSTFQGLASASTVSLPNKAYWALGSAQASSTKTLIRWTSYAIDEIVNVLEKRNWDMEEVCIVCTPDVRRQLKQTADFRNAENNQSFKGNENSRFFYYKGLGWVTISQDIRPPQSIAEGTRLFKTGSQFADNVGTTATTGYVALSTFTGFSSRLVTFAFVKKAFGVGFPSDFASYMRIAVRHDESDAVELYGTHEVGAVRIDDDGVLVIVFGTANPGTNDQP